MGLRILQTVVTNATGVVVFLLVDGLMQRIRIAEPQDHQGILQVHRLAFRRDDEAHLVDELIRDESARPLVSVVAEDQGALVGHGLFTTAWLTGPAPAARCSILAPLAVVPRRQRAGVGRELIEAGCAELGRSGVELVFVLGDPSYYSRCGFEPALPHGLRAPYAITPQEAWMVRALGPHGFGRARGTVVCARALQPQEYWRE